MSLLTRSFCALLLVLVCLPALAAADCLQIQSLSANNVQTGQPVTITWSYTGGTPQSQTITGHDFPAAIVLGPTQTSYTYTPSMPGEKHVQLAALTECGTISKTARYHVKQCNVIAPAVTVSETSVSPGDAFQASIDLAPGHTVRWEVTNGTASATTGASIQVTAGGAGTVTIDAWVSRGSSCSVKSSAAVQVVSACAINEPTIFVPDVATADSLVYADVFDLAPGETVTFVTHNAEPIYTDATFLVVVAPSTGSFSIDIVVTNATCSRTFTRSFTVQACTASAVVSVGATGECGPSTAVAELSGVAPFFGVWSDGQTFFGNETRIVRSIGAGTYTLDYFADQYCDGRVTGSVQGGGADLAVPVFTLAYEDGRYGDTCVGEPRTATIDAAVPSDATVEWTIANGTILSGQGTPQVQFAGTAPGQTFLTSMLRDAQGCPSEKYTYELMTLGTPLVDLSVQPSTIGAGGTAIITVTPRNAYNRSLNMVSSLGDSIVPINGSQWEYRATHGGGVATITAEMSNGCETNTVTTTLTIDGSNPAQATAEVRALGSDCESYGAFAEFTGIGPFSGTWSNGETFSNPEPYAFLRPPAGGTYTLIEFSDANGPGVVTGEATFDFTALPQPDFVFTTDPICPNSVVTATLTEPLPPGVTAHWMLPEGDIISGQGTATIQIRTYSGGGVQGQVMLSGPNSCSPLSPHHFKSLVPPPSPPSFGLHGIYTGETRTFDVRLDANTTTWGFENSLGDPMAIVGNPQPNVYTLSYTASHGIGSSTVRIYGTNQCGTAFEGTQVMQIFPPPPTVALTATANANCGATATATFTGIPPFTGTWSDTGESFTTSETTITHFMPGPANWLFINNFNDAYSGAPGGFVQVEDMKHVPQLFVAPLPDEICAGVPVTVQAFDVPEGYEVIWSELTNGRIISGQGTATLVVEPLQPGVFFVVQAALRSPEGCVGSPWAASAMVTACPAP